MGVIYSGQTIVNTLVDGSTADSLIAGLKNVLLSVSWSIVKDGTNDGIWRLRSSLTPQGMRGDLWVVRSAASPAKPLLSASSLSAIAPTTSLQASSQLALVVGAGYLFRVIASPFYAYILREAVPCPSYQSFLIMIPYLPPFLTGLITESVLSYGPWNTGASSYSICSDLFSGLDGAYSQLNGSGRTGAGQWMPWSLTAGTKPTWFDGSSEFYEARVQSYGTDGSGNTSGSRLSFGYFWDALVLNTAVARGTTIAYDGGSWLVITENKDPGLMVKVA